MAVRTRRLAEYSLAVGGGTVTVYTCPTDRTAIVKEVRVRMITGAGEFVVYVEGPNTGSLVLADSNNADARGQVNAECWTVLEEGDEIILYGTGLAGLLQTWISGTELLGDPA